MANNINSGNLPLSSNNGNNTQVFFNNYFKNNFNVSQAVNETILGYFETITGDIASAKTLAATVIFTCQSQGIAPMLMLDEFRKLQGAELTAYLTMFLNLNRVNTSLLGLTNSPQTSKYIQRCILP